MRQLGISTKVWKRGIAAFGAVAALALAPAPAQAQPCGDIPNIASDLLGIYLDQFEGYFTLHIQKNCDALQKTFYSACTSAVKDSLKCWDRQIATLPKAAASVCSEAVKPDQCNQSFKNSANDGQNEINSEASAEYSDCQNRANQLFSACFLN
jgi:hypothetical protein